MSASTKVFISYSTKDTEISNNVCSALEKAGFDCWIAPRDIKPGEDWAEAIIDGIDSSDFLVCVLTVSANESVQVKREIERAVSKKVSIIPFKVGDFELSKSMQYFLSSHHWLNVDEKNVDASIILLIEKLTGKKTVVAEAVKTPPIKEIDDIKPPTSQPSARKKSPAPAIAIIVALILAFVAYFFFIKSDDPSEVVENKEIIPANILDETIEPVNEEEKIMNDLASKSVEDNTKDAILVPKNITEGLNMITNPTFTFDKRNKMKDHIMQMFSGENAEVNIMIGDILDENIDINTFLERLVTLNDVNVEVLSVTRNDKGKIDKIFIETDM